MRWDGIGEERRGYGMLGGVDAKYYTSQIPLYSVGLHLATLPCLSQKADVCPERTVRSRIHGPSLPPRIAPS
jgi:hypothetical protein